MTKVIDPVKTDAKSPNGLSMFPFIVSLLLICLLIGAGISQLGPDPAKNCHDIIDQRNGVTVDKDGSFIFNDPVIEAYFLSHCFELFKAKGKSYYLTLGIIISYLDAHWDRIEDKEGCNQWFGKYSLEASDDDKALIIQVSLFATSSWSNNKITFERIKVGNSGHVNGFVSSIVKYCP